MLSWGKPFGGLRYNGRMPNRQGSAPMHGTTVLCVRKDNKAVLIADGQVTMGDHVLKHTAKKTRRLYSHDCRVNPTNVEDIEKSPWRAADWTLDPVRCAGDEVSRDEGAARSGLPGVRGPSDDSPVDRLP